MSVGGICNSTIDWFNQSACVSEQSQSERRAGGPYLAVNPTRDTRSKSNSSNTPPAVDAVNLMRVAHTYRQAEIHTWLCMHTTSKL